MKNKLWLLSVVVVLLATLAVTGCARPAQPTSTPSPTPTPKPTPTPTPTAKQHAPVELAILTGDVGKTSYIVANAYADIINKYHTWLKASAIPGFSAPDAIIEGKKRDPKTTLIKLDDPTYQYAKVGGLTFTRTYPEIKMITGGGQSYGLWHTLNPNIKSVNDFVGKKVGIVEKSMADYPFMMGVFTAMGVADKVTPVPLAFAAQQNNIKDGLLDVAQADFLKTPTGFVHHTFLDEIIVTHKDKMYLVPMPAKAVDYANKTLGINYMKGILPAKAELPSQTEPMEAWVHQFALLAVFDGFDDEVAYEFVKTIVEHIDALPTYHKSLASINRDTIGPSGMPLLDPTHPEKEVTAGALKYYMEKGLK